MLLLIGIALKMSHISTRVYTSLKSKQTNFQMVLCVILVQISDANANASTLLMFLLQKTFRFLQISVHTVVETIIRQDFSI